MLKFNKLVQTLFQVNHRKQTSAICCYHNRFELIDFNSGVRLVNPTSK